MYPIDFPEKDVDIQGPKSMPDCLALPAAFCHDTANNCPVIVSAWKLSPEELALANENGGIVYLGVCSHIMVPVWLTPVNPFQYQNEFNLKQIYPNGRDKSKSDSNP